MWKKHYNTIDAAIDDLFFQIECIKRHLNWIDHFLKQNDGKYHKPIQQELKM